jgi:hypothetical protein
MLKPDFVVFAPDLPETRLVVELKRSLFNRDAVANLIKEYMVARRCSVGLLITPTETWFLRDTYDSSGVEAIAQSGPYSTAELLGIDDVPDDEDAFASAVGRWLEGLTSGSAEGLRDGVQRDVSPYLLPAVTEGRVASGSLG